MLTLSHCMYLKVVTLVNPCLSFGYYLTAHIFCCCQVGKHIVVVLPMRGMPISYTSHSISVNELLVTGCTATWQPCVLNISGMELLKMWLMSRKRVVFALAVMKKTLPLVSRWNITLLFSFNCLPSCHRSLLELGREQKFFDDIGVLIQ